MTNSLQVNMLLNSIQRNFVDMNILQFILHVCQSCCDDIELKVKINCKY